MINQAPISVEKILLLPLHIKLGLLKQFVKALDPAGAAFQHIRQMFPSLPDAKFSGGIFVESQIKVMLANKDLEDKMSAVEKRAYAAITQIVQGFLSKSKSDNYKELVENLNVQYAEMKCRRYCNLLLCALLKQINILTVEDV